MELIDLITDPKIRGYVGDALIVTTLAMPVLDKIVNMTTNKWDNQVFAMLQKFLAFVPRGRFGEKPAPSRMSAPTKPETPSAKADLGS